MRKTSICLLFVGVCAVGFMLWDADSSPVIQQSVHDVVQEDKSAHMETTPAQEEDQTEEHEEESEQKKPLPKQKKEKKAQSVNWLKERKALWKRDGPMLMATDKAMYRHLDRQLHDKESKQWARYLRHKNLRPPTPVGHKWEDNSGSMHGSLEELQADMKPKARLCDQTVKQHHGYFRIKGGKDKNYFYWLFEARENPEHAPVVLWLTGGPGCSSEIALFGENGPCSVRAGGKSTKMNPYSWNRKSTIIFVDQPAGTGFSYGARSDMDRSEKQVSNDLYHFMQEVVKHYPKYHKQRFYIFGESYAGHFVPAFGHRLLMGNKAHEGEYIAFKGQAIGNGLTDPEIQYPYYPQMAFNSKTTKPVITKAQYKRMVSAIPTCVKDIRGCKKDKSMCSAAFIRCNAALIDPVQDTGKNVYDLRQKCKNPPLCYDFAPMSTFLRSKKVKKILGVKKEWADCNFAVNGMFHTDWMRSQRHKIPPVLENGIRTMVYAGDVDFICNWMGNKAWTLKMPWSSKAGFGAAKDKDWSVNGKVVGRERKHGTLSFLQIHKAGHMVPMDQPEVAMLMLNSFIANKALIPSDE